jgi:hypothetical protein
MCNWRLILPRLHLSGPWGSTTSYTPRLGWGRTSPDSSLKPPNDRGLPSADQPVELSWACLDEVVAVLQSGVRLLQPPWVTCAASRNLHWASAEIYSNWPDHGVRLREAPCTWHTHETAAYIHIQVHLGCLFLGRRCSSDRSPMSSAGLHGPQYLQ